MDGSTSLRTAPDVYFLPVEDGAWLRNSGGSFTIRGKFAYPLLEWLLPMLDGETDRAHLAAAAGTQWPAVEWLLGTLISHAFVREVDPNRARPSALLARLYPEQLTFLDCQVPDPVERFAAFRSRHIAVVGRGALLRAATACLCEMGAATLTLVPDGPDPRLTCLLTAARERDGELRADVLPLPGESSLGDAATAALTAGATVVVVAADPAEVTGMVGSAVPLAVLTAWPGSVFTTVVPDGERLCLTCLGSAGRSASPPPPAASLAAQELATSVFLDSVGLAGPAQAVTVGTSRLSVRRHRVPAHPDDTACEPIPGPAAAVTPTAADTPVTGDVADFLAWLHSDPLGVGPPGQVAVPLSVTDLGRLPLSGARPGWLPAPTVVPGSFEWLGDLLFRAVGCQRVSWSPDGSRFSSPEQPPPPDPRRTLEVRRAVASGGAKYPCEVFVLSRSFPGLPDGVFHVDATQHELAMVAPAPASAAWLAAVPSGGELPRLTFVLVCRFTNSTPKYGNFAYRLSAVDTGVVAGRLCSLLADDGVPHRLRFGFNDDALDTIIGAHSGIEGSYAVVTTDPTPLPPSVPMAATLTGTALPAELARAHAAARQWTTTPAVETEPLTLELINRRRSDGALFDGRPVSATVLDAMLAEVAARFRQFSVAVADWPMPPLRLGVAVHRAGDVPAGVYLAGETGGLRPLRQGDVSDRLQQAMHIGNVNLRLAAFVVHVFGPAAAWSGEWGPRGYRTSQMVVGAVVDAITVAAARAGLSANPFLGFDTADVGALYPGLGQDEIPLVQVAVGGTRPAPRMEGPVTA